MGRTIFQFAAADFTSLCFTLVAIDLYKLMYMLVYLVQQLVAGLVMEHVEPPGLFMWL